MKNWFQKVTYDVNDTTHCEDICINDCYIIDENLNRKNIVILLMRTIISTGHWPSG